jgi:hypothetical protein
MVFVVVYSTIVKPISRSTAFDLSSIYNERAVPTLSVPPDGPDVLPASTVVWELVRRRSRRAANTPSLTPTENILVFTIVAYTVGYKGGWTGNIWDS